MIEILILVSIGCMIGFLLAIILLSRRRSVTPRVWETGTIPVWLPSTTFKESKQQQKQKNDLNHSSQDLILQHIPKRRGEPQGKPIAMLTVKGGKYHGHSWLMRYGKAISIGRFEQCNIVLDEQNIAPLHAQITHRNSNRHRFTIFDYSANNETFVNGKRVTAVALLEDEAQIQIGDTNLIFQRIKEE